MQKATFHSTSLEDTCRFGEALAAALFPGAVVALVGSLGAGKTNLVQAVAAALGADRTLVTSPTFVLVHEYAARMPVYHFDAYRLAGAAEFAELGVDEYFAGSGVCLIEWADRVRDSLPDEYLEVRIAITGSADRHFELTGHGDAYERLIEHLVKSGTAGPDGSMDCSA